MGITFTDVSQNIFRVIAMNEEWRDIIGYEGYYQVSDLGRIRSIDRTFVKSDGKISRYQGMIRQQAKSWNAEYLSVGLSIMGKNKFFMVHRLVAIAFIPNPENKPEVNHLYGDKTDNRALHLEWATKSENANHAVRTGLSIPPKSNLGKFGSLSHRKRAINVFTLNREFIRSFTNIREGSIAFNIKETTISNNLNGRSKRAGNFIWEYIG